MVVDMRRTAPRRILVAVVAFVTALVVSGSVALAGTDSPTPGATPSEKVARRFLDAYGAFETNRALQYLTKDAIAGGVGHSGSWGDRPRFRADIALSRAQGIKQLVTSCEEQGRSARGVGVRCDFDLHAIRSDELGLGPYTGNSWELTVRDGKITSAAATWDFMANGFSKQMWEPFTRWVSSTHPGDVAVMFPEGTFGNPGLSDASIRLWDERSREYVAAVKATR
jgi:hypothetical protein